VTLDPLQVIRSEVGAPNERWPALESLTRIREAESSGELLTDELEQTIENGPQWLRLARATRLTGLMEEEGIPETAENLRRVWQGLSLAQLMWTVTPGVIEILIGDPATSTTFLNRLVHGGSQFARLRLSLELLLRRHRDGEELLSEEFDEIVSSVDEKAAHQPLWTAGLDYWEKMTGSRWAPSDKRHEPPHPEGSIEGDESIQESDTRARRALAEGEFETAIRLFERVRAMCLAIEPPITTTEQAARLNLAWALWKHKRPQSEWEPHILSVIEEVAPPIPGLVDVWSRTHSSREEAGL
jgi:hypothetical protein